MLVTLSHSHIHTVTVTHSNSHIVTLTLSHTHTHRQAHSHCHTSLPAESVPQAVRNVSEVAAAADSWVCPSPSLLPWKPSAYQKTQTC